MVSTHLKNISQIGSFPQVGMKIKNLWNHHLDNVTTISFQVVAREVLWWMWDTYVLLLELLSCQLWPLTARSWQLLRFEHPHSIALMMHSFSFVLPLLPSVSGWDVCEDVQKYCTEGHTLLNRWRAGSTHFWGEQGIRSVCQVMAVILMWFSLSRIF